MIATDDAVIEFAANDLMHTDIVTVRLGTSVRRAIQLLMKSKSSLAAVVNDAGRCVGSLSATQVLRFAERKPDLRKMTAEALPLTCSFQRQASIGKEKQITECTLPAGACPLQMELHNGDAIVLACSDPHCVLCDWQIVDLERLPEEDVEEYMCSDPITAPTDTPVPSLARLMVQKQTQRIIVVDAQQRPVGLVSGTDILRRIACTQEP